MRSKTTKQGIPNIAQKETPFGSWIIGVTEPIISIDFHLRITGTNLCIQLAFQPAKFNFADANPPSFGPLFTLRGEEQLQYVPRFVRFGAGIMAKKKASGDEKAMANLQAVPGVGKSTAQKLVNSGIRTANQLAKASTKKLLAAGLSSGMAAKLAAAAAKSAGKKVAAKAKAAPKKAAAKAKTIAMSAKTAAAKGTAKVKKKAADKKKAPAKKKAAVKKKDAKTVEVRSKTIPTPDWRASMKKWKND
jgi:uncharacterized protein YoaH (UPF0181 family)